MIDNLPDAIAHERKEAENYTITSNALYEDYYKVSLNCQEIANYHEQLASWLEELQERREADKKLKETLEEMSERLKDSLFGDGIRFALKVINKSRKREQESEDK